MFLIICYDVPAKRTRVYKRLLKGFLLHEQASVFMGDLPESKAIELVAEISKEIEPEDRVLKLVCKNRHNIEAYRLSKEAAGGQMRQEKHAWFGKDWALV